MPVTAQRYEPDADLAQLRDHPRNPRRGDDSSVAASLDRNGWYGAIIAQQSTRQILAGHTRRRVLTSTGEQRGPVIWVDCDDETATRILLADNRTAELASWDTEALAALLGEIPDLMGTGYDAEAFDALVRDLAGPVPDEKYAREANAPHYEPSGTQPAVSEMYDQTRTSELLAAIEAAEVPASLKDFLIAAAHRHTVFRYDRIADYYADASPAEQRLMEDSALVIVDLDDAIRLGYAKLASTLQILRELDEDDADEDEA
jgi:hypothetical protein